MYFFPINRDGFSLELQSCLKFSDENKMGVQIIEVYFHKIDKIKVAGAKLSY